MPELPEVQTIAAGLHQYLRNRQFISVSCDAEKLFPNAEDRVERYLIGSFACAVHRRGKAIMIELSSGYALVIHLKMTGQLIFVSPDMEERIPEKMPGRFTHIIFRFADGSHLYFNDQRKFGWIKLMSQAEIGQLKFLNDMGPEPLTDEFNPKYLAAKIKKRQASIKAVILDQKVVAGVGNIYADESLFLSGIMPDRPAGGLKQREIKELCANIKKVLAYSIELGGSSRKDYVNAIGRKGDYLNEAYVYGREGEPCRQCGHLLEKRKVAGRGTHYCPECQK